MDKHDNLFGALADSTRRAILQLLLKNGNMTAGQLADEFPDISRPAVSRHVRVLREASLVSEKKEGREIYYSLNRSPLRELDDWLQNFWVQSLDALKELVETEIVKQNKEESE